MWLGFFTKVLRKRIPHTLKAKAVEILRQIVTYEELPEFAETPAVEGIIIEAGGMTDPRGLQKLLTNSHLAAWFNGDNWVSPHSTFDGARTFQSVQLRGD